MKHEEGWTPPPYPYDRLEPIRAVAASLPGGAVDLSIGTPCDAPPAEVVVALATSGRERGYPPSIGLPTYREAVSTWFERRLDVTVPVGGVAACVGTKEFVASTPSYLRLRSPGRDTVLYPAVSYPTYAMGATLAGCRAVPVPVDDRWRIRLDAVSEADAERALCLWVNSPGNPAGGLDDLTAAAAWGRERGVPVFSDECYVEFTWSGPPVGEVGLPGATILSAGLEGVLAVHSLSKRSNLAGVRAGFYAGDPALVHFLSEVRKHAGLMVPGPVQAAARVALSDQTHVTEQRERYSTRLDRLSGVLRRLGLDVPAPAGTFYLWVPAPGGDAWTLADRLAESLGVIGSPGEFYGPDGAAHVRLAVVEPDEALDLVEERAARLPDGALA